jgi:ADP-ribose pyrophosphatase YjhB (NUDIX family)
MIKNEIRVILIRQNKVLLGKNKEGEWILPGRALKEGECLENAAKDEVFNETSIKLNYSYVFCINNEVQKNSHILNVGIYSENFIGDEEVKSNKVSEWGWFEIADLPFPIEYISAKTLQNYSKKKFYISG